MPTRDPVTALVEALERDGKPPLAWVVRWSADGHEPVWAAWQTSRDPWAMVQLLMRTGRDWPLGRYQLVDGRGLRRKESPQGESYIVLGDGPNAVFLPRDAASANEIRKRVPVPPSLQVLLGRGRRGFTRPSRA